MKFYLAFLTALFAFLGQNTRAQKATMYIPHQYAMDADTSIWVLPYLIPVPDDYAKIPSITMYSRKGKEIVEMQIHTLEEENSTANTVELEKALQGSLFGWPSGNDFKTLDYGQVHFQAYPSQQQVKKLRGYHRFAPNYYVVFSVFIGPEFDHLSRFCKSLSEQLETLHLIEPRLIDEQARLPYDQFSNPQQKSATIITLYKDRLKLRPILNLFLEKPLETALRKNPLPTFKDSLNLINRHTTPNINAFTCARVSQEIESLRTKTISEERAIWAYFNDQLVIHPDYKAQAREIARNSIQKTLNQQLNEVVYISAFADPLLRESTTYCFQAHNTKHCYFVFAQLENQIWSYKAVLVNSTPSNCIGSTAQTEFTAYKQNASTQPDYQLQLRKDRNAGSLGLGFAPEYRLIQDRVLHTGYNRFVVQTHTAMSEPLFFEAPDLSKYVITYEIKQTYEDYSPQSFGGPFYGSTSISGKKWSYSRFYNWEKVTYDDMIKPNAHSANYPPAQRAYQSPIYVTDFNSNGFEEAWYVVVSEGQVVMQAGVEASPKGPVPLVFDESWVQNVANQPGVQEIIHLSSIEMDPFATQIKSEGHKNEIPAPNSTRYIQEEQSKNEALTFADEMPMYPGGDHQMHQDLLTNFKYPESVNTQDVKVTIYLQFIVEKDGSISNVKTVRGSKNYPEFSNAAETAVKGLKKFKPAKMNGKPVRLTMTIPFKIHLR